MFYSSYRCFRKCRPKAPGGRRDKFGGSAFRAAGARQMSRRLPISVRDRGTYWRLSCRVRTTASRPHVLHLQPLPVPISVRFYAQTEALRLGIEMSRPFILFSQPISYIVTSLERNFSKMSLYYSYDFPIPELIQQNNLGFEETLISPPSRLTPPRW